MNARDGWILIDSAHLPVSEMKWHHYKEPRIIDVTSYDDATRAIGYAT